MIEGTFSFVKGIGPARERELRLRGIRSWDAFPAAGPVLSAPLDARIRKALDEMQALLDEGSVVEAVGRLPAREQWRGYPRLEPRTTFLDIETSFDQRPTVIGTYSLEAGPKLFVRGWNLGDFVREPLGDQLVTFNGLSFDVPILRRTFPAWRPPPLHLDLRPVLAQLDERGGLKAIEKRVGLARPAHLDGVGGEDALYLWDAFRRRQDAVALRKLCEYNLYDVIQLRSLAQLAVKRLAERTGWPVKDEKPFHRADILVDVTRLLERLVADARRIVPEAIDDEERRTGL